MLAMKDDFSPHTENSRCYYQCSNYKRVEAAVFTLNTSIFVKDLIETAFTNKVGGAHEFR